MSAQIVPASMQAVAELHETSPILFKVITDTMGIQPTIDPEAGYGVFQAATLFFDLELSDEDAIKLVQICEYDPYKFYVFLRSHYMGGLSLGKLKEYIAGSTRPNFRKIYRELVILVPSMKRKGMLNRLS